MAVLASLSLSPRDVPPENWNDWRWQLRNSVQAEDIAKLLELTDDERLGLAAAGHLFRVGATPYYFSLIDREHPHCPVRRQIIPWGQELRTVPAELLDPLGEDTHNPTPAIVHKYPDRVLLLALDRCAIYCRHCNRRRLVGGDDPPTRAELEQAFDYIARTRRIRDVLISGGDPLCLSTEKLDYILSRVRAIPHVEIIRIGTRVPVVLPMRIDDALVAMLRKHHPLFVNTHFNHAKEITAEARRGCEKLVDAGIPVGNQAVLLRGVNSSVRSLRRLFRELLKMRVKPYYLFQGDTVVGTDHLRTPVETAIELMAGLRGWMSGMAIPHLVIDAPGGGGKVPIGPKYLADMNDERVMLRNYRGQSIEYPQPQDKDCTVPYDSVFFADELPDDDREGGA
ncbi:MAG: KamA family radical SAM protein [Deltaproteobacteria bacterium]|nr:KamA family radical SAM protein [Deltaproteobacteria bacterium]